MDEIIMNGRADGRAHVFELLTTGLVVAEGQDCRYRAVGIPLAIRAVMPCSCSNLVTLWSAADMLTDKK